MFCCMKTILHLVMVLIPALFMLALGMAVVLGIGALLAYLLPLSLYQASLLTVFTALVLVFIWFVVSFLSRFPTGGYNDDGYWEDEDDEDDWEDEEDDDDWDDDGSPLVLHPTVRRDEPKVGRNAPCPCGSGKKYKNCCGRANDHADNDSDSLPF